MRKIFCGVAVVSLAGCAAGSAAAEAAHGTRTRPAPRGIVAGRLQREGGPTSPAGGQPPVLPLRGTVGLTRRAHRLVAVGRSGTFSVRLAPGTYQVTGSSPDLREQRSGGRTRVRPCAQPTAVTVIAGRTARITLNCIVP